MYLSKREAEADFITELSVKREEVALSALNMEEESVNQGMQATSKN